MIKPTEITNAGAAAGYYSQQSKASEYYSGEATPSAWSGKGAQIQGLKGPVDGLDLTRQLEGKIADIMGIRELGRIVKGEREHCAGWDFTVSSPKSVSIEALVYGNKAALEAHRRAAQAAMAYLEAHAQAVIRGQRVTTGNLTMAGYEHVLSREGDPQLHVHFLVSNVTFDENGKAYSLANRGMFQHYRAADAIYHSSLSHELQRAGIPVRHDHEGRVEIDSYSRTDIEDFSGRSKQILAFLEARGLTREQASAELRNMAALGTRKDKEYLESRAANAERWQAQAEALGIKPTELDPETAKAMRQLKPAEAAKAAVDAAKLHLTEREYVFADRDLHQQAARFSAGACTWAEIQKEIARQEKSGELLSKKVNYTPLYTTSEAIEAEKSVAALAAGQGEHMPVMNASEFEAALAQFEARKSELLEKKDFSLTSEQRAAASMILTGDDRFQGVQGLAGTGKTTMLEFVREAAQSKGWSIVGHSNGSEQAAKMEQESGIKSTTTARHLIDEHKAADTEVRSDVKQKPAAPIRELRIMDEASQAGQREFNDVIRTTEAAGARTVFLGDKLQHQSVEAGRAFERAQEHMPVSGLGADSIRRQTTAHMKDAVKDILDKRHADALSRIKTVEIRDAQNSLKPDATRDEKREAAKLDNAAVIKMLASDYTKLNDDERSETIVITSTNEDRRAINEAIRDGLKQQGALGTGIEVTTLRKADLTKEESKLAANYLPGQIIETTSKTERFLQGTQLEIIKADSRTNTLTARDGEGKEHIIDVKKMRLGVYEPEKREFAVGDRIKLTENHQLTAGVRVRNGQTATVEQVTADRLTLRLQSGERVEIDARKRLKAEHGYASTSHAAQGQTVNRVLIHHNVHSGHHGDREGYVNITRAREDAVLYT
ncbi:MAG: relaxase domain-containing protein, partial [Betaproteobacteria bacterium]|nr:relaxase domain-containing protein [Betaproteobacteria bacterium]